MQNSTENNKIIFITKASGDVEPFESHKLESSLIKAGADGEIIKEIVEDIKSSLQQGQTTKEIYKRAFRLLKKKRNVPALYYKLKQAIFEFGPTGYPFEHLVAQIFTRQGYYTEVGKIVQGWCVSHEIDVLATKDKEQHIVECKYSENQGKQISIQTPLYVRSRVDDIVKKREIQQDYNDFRFTGWLLTNTRFSSDSIAYGKCSGLKIISWDYPQGKGLKDLIEEAKIWPVTILSSITKKEKQFLLDRRVVTCRQLLNNLGLITEMELSKRKSRKLQDELEDICS
jgi:hypothetical protein